jgi:heme exporter protein D
VTPDLGPYAVPVLAAYGVTFALLGGLVARSLARAAQVRAALARRERAAGGGRDGGA